MPDMRRAPRAAPHLEWVLLYLSVEVHAETLLLNILLPFTEMPKGLRHCIAACIDWQIAWKAHSRKQFFKWHRFLFYYPVKSYHAYFMSHLTPLSGVTPFSSMLSVNNVDGLQKAMEIFPILELSDSWRRSRHDSRLGFTRAAMAPVNGVDIMLGHLSLISLPSSTWVYFIRQLYCFSYSLFNPSLPFAHRNQQRREGTYTYILCPTCEWLYADLRETFIQLIGLAAPEASRKLQTVH